MTKFPNAMFILHPKKSIIGVMFYTIKHHYVIAPCIGMFTIPDSINVDAQDQILPTNEFHSLIQKMNNGCLIFDDVMFRKKKIQMKHIIYSLLEVLIHVKFSY